MIGETGSPFIRSAWDFESVDIDLGVLYGMGWSYEQARALLSELERWVEAPPRLKPRVLEVLYRTVEAEGCDMETVHATVADFEHLDVKKERRRRISRQVREMRRR